VQLDAVVEQIAGQDGDVAVLG